MKFSEVSKELNKHFEKGKEKGNTSLYDCSIESPNVTDESDYSYFDFLRDDSELELDEAVAISTPRNEQTDPLSNQTIATPEQNASLASNKTVATPELKTPSSSNQAVATPEQKATSSSNHPVANPDPKPSARKRTYAEANPIQPLCK